MTTWGDLFNPRQHLALITFAEKMRQAYATILARGYPEDFARTVATYLGLSLNRLATYSSLLSMWVSSDGEFVAGTFAQGQSLPMRWDSFEVNPFSEATGGWRSAQKWIHRVMEHLPQISSLLLVKKELRVRATHVSATRLPYPDNHFDAVLTDPPYYDNVPYSYLSDFFYVWLKRTVGHIYPDLFTTPLTPKGEEIVAYSHGEGGFEEGRRFFEEQLARSFREMHRVLKPKGIAVIVYAHKSTEGWETVINALLDCGLVIRASWPLNTERQSRQRANESAALASSIYIVARKMQREPVGIYNEVREDLRRYLHERLDDLWSEGLTGADFFIAAIGAGIEIFGRYEQVIDMQGEVVRADRLLDDVRKIVADYALNRILRTGNPGELSPLTRFYLLYRWEFGEAKALFDEARKLAQACGIDLESYWTHPESFIRKEKGLIRVLGPRDRKLEDLKKSHELIDVLHLALRYWETGRQDAIRELLQRTGWGRRESFYRTAQAIAEALPPQSQERKLLEGFLLRKVQYAEASPTLFDPLENADQP